MPFVFDVSASVQLRSYIVDRRAILNGHVDCLEVSICASQNAAILSLGQDIHKDISYKSLTISMSPLAEEATEYWGALTKNFQLIFLLQMNSFGEP